MAAALNEDETMQTQDNLLIGTGAKVYRAPAGWKAEDLENRAGAGAEFIQTQLCMNVDIVKNWLPRLVETRPYAGPLFVPWTSISYVKVIRK